LVSRVLYILALLRFGVGFRRPRDVSTSDPSSDDFDAESGNFDLNNVDAPGSPETDAEVVDVSQSFVEADASDGEEEGKILSRRRRDRRRRDRRRRDRRRDRRRRTAPCPDNEARVWPDPGQEFSLCCGVNMEGGWKHAMSVFRTQTLTISYGYQENTQKYDLYQTYRSSMKAASVGFKVFGFGGSVEYKGDKSAYVVSEAYINTTVNFNMTWTATWVIEDGRYVYQWVWTAQFKNSTPQCNLPDAHIGTVKFVQADRRPRCLPGTNLDPRYRECEPGAELP